MRWGPRVCEASVRVLFGGGSGITPMLQAVQGVTGGVFADGNRVVVRAAIGKR